MGPEGNLGEGYEDKEGFFGYAAARCRITAVNEYGKVHQDTVCPYNLLHSLPVDILIIF